jgi:hypothetical protein
MNKIIEQLKERQILIYKKIRDSGVKHEQACILLKNPELLNYYLKAKYE